MTFSKSFRLKPGRHFQHTDWDTAENGGLEKADAVTFTEKNAERLFKLQYKLYAENKRSLLIILQGMDAAGKDGVIRHVIRGFNPQGITVTPFKAPSAEELDHDFLWRIHKAVPARGDIGVFNRSHYEDVLIVRVQNLVPKPVWKARYKQINHFEKMLTQNGMTILKFYLHVSEQEQAKRLKERMADPDKNWKFNPGDMKERKRWADYMKAYADMMTECSTEWAPWHVIPADKKWFRNFAISKIIGEAMESMKLKLPKHPA